MLSKIFNEFTNSYKFFFFPALLDGLERNQFEANIPLSLPDIVLDMLVLAWYPHVYFRLSFGKQDQLADTLDKSVSRASFDGPSLKPWDKTSLRKKINENTKLNELARYVPYRLIRPFFPETRGMKDNEVNMRVAELAEEYFAERKPLYKIDNKNKQLFIHPAWAEYFRKNLSVIRGWSHWNLTVYMQRCNPNVPAVSSKLFAPAQRESLAQQTFYWREVLKRKNFNCIYSGEILDYKNFSLDHFVPWSFVVHDQLWNLVPTSKSVNSKKSDNLPSLKYFPKLVDMQFEGLNISRSVLKPKTWQDSVECFIADLGLPNYEALGDESLLVQRYDATIKPLLMLAECNGFESSWRYQL